VSAFNQFVRPLERAQGTRSKYMTHRLSILTWAVWKGCLSQLLPMTDDLLRAYLWDSLAFEASVSVLRHAVDAVKGWQTCDIWWGYDYTVGGWAEFKAGAAYDIKVRKNDNVRAWRQARVGVPKDGRYDLLAQTKGALRLLGTTPGPLCDGCTLPSLPSAFPRRIKKGTEFDLSKQATSPEISAMILSGLAHVGFNTAGFSGISARKGGLSTAIKAGVPEAILWIQSGHTQDVAARRYVSLNSPALLYRIYEVFDL
jgi:hypothetical protein